MRLRFIFATGCPACDGAKKPLAAFEKAHPEVQIERIDLLTSPWKESWQIEATPTYVLDVPGYKSTQYVGALTKPDIEKFIAKSFQVMGVRR